MYNICGMLLKIYYAFFVSGRIFLILPPRSFYGDTASKPVPVYDMEKLPKASVYIQAEEK